MSIYTSNNSRIAKNTILLYFRMILTMLVSLYTSRVVLNTLGVSDFGIYNVVGGIVAMLGFLNGSMSVTTQRFITFELGRGNYKRLRIVFNTSLLILAILSLILVLIAETLGLWFLWHKMQIPVERMDAAFYVFQGSIVTAVIFIMSVPFNAIIIAHERMSAFAYISIIEVLLKLAIVYLLLFFPYDKLVLYAFLIVCVQFVIFLSYRFYCIANFQESRFMLVFCYPYLKKMAGFTGWTFLGNLASVTYTQGLNILLNLFFGPMINAARGIAVQVQNAITQFSINFQMALNPQITKMYAIDDLPSMYKLIERSSKFTFCLLLLLSFPVILEADFILKLWLGIVPKYTVLFLRLILCTAIIDAVANPLMVSAAATGKVKLYHSAVGGLLLTILPISYVVLKNGGAPESVFIVHLLICVIAFVVRLYILQSLIYLDIKRYLYNVVGKSVLIMLTALPLPVMLKFFLVDNAIFSLMVVCVVCLFAVSISSFYIGLDKYERCFIKEKLSVLLLKVKGGKKNT